MEFNKFAEFVNNNSVSPSAGSSSASISWSANDVSQFLEDDETEISPQGSTSVTTTLRGSGSASISSSTAPQKSVQIRDTFGYSNQPSVNARVALVMDAQTGEVLYSKIVA